MQPISRRNALVLGGVGVAGVLVGGTGLIAGWSPIPSGVNGREFVEPESLHSSGGSLQVHLSAAEGPVRIAGRDATALT